MNSRVFPYQATFVKEMARRLNIGEAAALRIIIDLYIKLTQENDTDETL